MSSTGAMRSRGASGLAALAAASLLAVATQEAQAANDQLDFTARVGGLYSDNANRTDTNTESSAAAVAGLTLLARRPVGRWRYDASGDMSYYRFTQSGIGGQLYGGAAGKSSYGIVPESFEWNVAGSLSQIRQDLLRPEAPGNLENVVSLSTGPTVRAHFGDSFEATLDGTAATTRYSRRNFDSDTVGAKLVVLKRFSLLNSLGLGASADRVSYKSQVGLGTTNFNRREAFLTYTGASARSSVDLEAGYSKFTGGTLDSSNPVFRIHARRRLTHFLSGYLDYSQEYPTSDENVYTAPVTAGLGGGVDDSILTAGPRSLKSTGIGIALAWPRTLGDVGYSRRDEKSLGPIGTQRTYDEAHLKLTRLLTPRSNISVYGSYTKDRASGLLLDITGNVVGAQYGLNFGKALGLDIRVQRNAQSSPFVISRYSELSAGVFLRYGLAATSDFR